MQQEKGKKNKAEMPEELRLIALRFVLNAQSLVEDYDLLKGTSLHKGIIKSLSNNLVNILTPILIKEYTNVYKSDPEMCTNVTREIETLKDRFVKSPVYDLVMINQIFTHYENHKDDWKNLFAVELTQLDT